MAPSHQLPLALPLPRRRAMGRADFIESGANADVAALVCAPARWPDGRLALVGPEGAGKTHLVHALMAETGALGVAAAELDPDRVPAMVAVGCVAVEDVDRHGGEVAAETGLFHLLNLARAEGVPVLLTGRTAPGRWPVRLPDLASRLAAVAPVHLSPPDDALLAAVIAKLLADRVLTHEDGLPVYLARRIERSFAAAQAVVERLDAASFAERRNLTRRLAAEVLDASGIDGGG